MDLVSVTVNNETYPMYGLDAFEQVLYGIRFSMIALMPPFTMGSNDLLFTVRITYSRSEIVESKK